MIGDDGFRVRMESTRHRDCRQSLQPLTHRIQGGDQTADFDALAAKAVNGQLEFHGQHLPGLSLQLYCHFRGGFR